jgi:isochorismate synthase
MGLLLYQNFEGENHQSKGVWKSSGFDEIIDKEFFITNFEGTSCFTFIKENDLQLSMLQLEIGKINVKQSSNFILEKNQYQKSLRDFKQAMHEREITKAIFSRIDQVNGEFNALEIYNALCQKYEGKAFVYLIADDEFGIWIGATPEVLIKGDENNFSTMALAGTKAGKQISWTPKEIEEQRLVSQFIQTILEHNAVKNLHVSDTKTVFSGSVYHLSTKFIFQYEISKITKLIRELHPTPAVCGLPRTKARELIQEFEPHQRNFYTGILGRINKSEVQTYVNLRCMEFFKNKADLYVGGGITNDSVIESEWDETQIKANTLKSVLV